MTNVKKIYVKMISNEDNGEERNNIEISKKKWNK